jgi:opacity protein-like surface antigen
MLLNLNFDVMLKFLFRPSRTFLSLLLIFPLFSFAQQMKIKNNYAGVLSVGGRSTISTFNDGKWGDIGIGSGGQFMLQASNRVNTAWFFDYITGGVGNFANKTDYHIGWSVMYYLVPSNAEKTPAFQPYVLAGHCFDYANIKDNSHTDNFAERWSSAVQGGLGTHINLSSRFDLNLQGQYMIHLGNDIDAEQENGAVVFHKNAGVNLQGHILITLGVNYKVADLW